MPKYLSDDELLSLFSQYQSIEKIAQVTGMNNRSLYARRRALEQRYKTPLTVKNPKPEFAHLAPREHKPRFDLGIENGVVIIGSDAHIWPRMRTTAMQAFIKLSKELSPKAVILNGDVFDGASVSRFPRIGWDNRPSVREELQACQETLMEIEEAAGRAKLVWCLGNHDSRFEVKLAASAGEYEGVRGFSLKDHFPKWAPTWSCWLGDHTIVKHRWHNGIHATYNNTLKSGKNIVTGHLHRLQATTYSDYNGTRHGIDSGTLAEPLGPQFMDYLEQNCTNWASGFVVLTLHKGKLLWPEFVNVMNQGVVQFRGGVFKV